MRMIIAIKIIDIEKLIRLATAKIRLAKRRNGIIGSGTSRSRMIKPAKSTTPIPAGRADRSNELPRNSAVAFGSHSRKRWQIMNGCW